jgi:elongator complex protein 3
LYGFIRLLLPDAAQAIDFPWLWQGTAIVRELHVYGVLQTFGEKSEEAVQHSWLWKKLLRVAEHLSAEEGFSQLSVISWVGVREYYAKLGYTLSGTYMVKKCEMLKKVKATWNFSANL